MPQGSENIFDWFWRIRRKLRSGMNGPEPIGYDDLYMFMRVTGEIIDRDEIPLLLEIDDVYISTVQEEHELSLKRNEKK